MEPQDLSRESIVGAIQEFLRSLPYEAETLLAVFTLRFNAYQIAAAVLLFGLAMLLARVLQPRMHDWMRTLEGWPKWRLRWLVVIHRRMRMILFTLLLWITYLILLEVAFPSWSWLLGIFARLTSAWLIVVFATRLIGNSLLRTTVRYGAWIWVTLSILNLTGPTEQFLESLAVTFGDTRLSMWLVLQALVLLAILITGARMLAVFVAGRIRENTEISPSIQVLAIKLMQVLLYGAAFFLGLKLVGVDLTGLAVLSGAIGVGLGFGLQKVVSNLVSGVIILLDKSIKPGDVISLGETFGWINTLGARYTSVVTRDGREYLIPNEDLITGQVVNWSHSDDFVRLDIHFGASYQDDPHNVRKLAIEAAKSVDRVLSTRAPVCHITGFGDSSVDYILRFWISDPTGGLTNIRGNVFLALWDTFNENGVSIPFPQREVRLLKDGPTEAAAAAAAAAAD